MIEQERQIRFLYPPFFMLASLLLGLHLDSKGLEAILPTAIVRLDVGQLVGLIAILGVTVLPLGFLIGSISIFLLRLISFLFGKRNYEAVLSPKAMERIGKQLQISERLVQRDMLYAAATFDHELLSKPIHSWIQRRWSVFNTQINSVVALAFALTIGPSLSIQRTESWTLITIIVCAILLFNAFMAWRETMKMIEFQSQREFRNIISSNLESPKD